MKTTPDKAAVLGTRGEIEEIIKAEHIDRRRFREASKLEYQSVIRRFYYSFADHEKRPNITLNCNLFPFHSRLERSELVVWGGTSETGRLEWEEFIHSISALVPEGDTDRRVYLITGDGWVYEGYIPELIAVMTATGGMLVDFYIVPMDYDWVIVFSEDGDSLFRLG